MKAPAFQLYAADFLVDTLDWSATQVGIYFRLLMYEWVNGSIPNDCKRMARISGVDVGNFKKCYLQDIENKFVPNGEGDLVNLRLERTREKQANYIKSQQESGKRGAEKRWRKDSKPISDPISDPNGENMALQSSSSTIKIKDNIPYEEIVSYLNEKTGKHFKPASKGIQRLIKARWNEDKDYQTVDAFKYVIDVKCKSWMGDPKNEKYLRPKTLFNQENFESYINEVIYEDRPKHV